MLCDQPVGKFLLFFAGVVMKSAKTPVEKWGKGGLTIGEPIGPQRNYCAAYGPNRSLRLCWAL